MYITGKYWGEDIGGSDDSLTLLEYLAAKGKEEISLGEVFADFGLDKLRGDFRRPEEPLVYENEEGWEMPLTYAIDGISTLAALLLECKVNGGLDTEELELETELPAIRLTAAPEELALICGTLADFAAAPAAYDLSEMLPEEELRGMADLCGELGQELQG